MLNFYESLLPHWLGKERVVVRVETVSGHAISEFIKEAFPYLSRIKVNPKASQRRDAKEDFKGL